MTNVIGGFLHPRDGPAEKIFREFSREFSREISWELPGDFPGAHRGRMPTVPAEPGNGSPHRSGRVRALTDTQPGLRPVGP